MELKDIGDAIGIPNRTMRYIMEQGLVPGLSNVNQGRGSRRSMSIRQARLVAVAAVLHELGYRGPVVKDLLKQAKPQLQAQQHPLMLVSAAHGYEVRVDVPVAELYATIATGPMDIAGQRFGKLVARVRERRGAASYWLCDCDCGQQVSVYLGSLRRENGTRSCGCARETGAGVITGSFLSRWRELAKRRKIRFDLTAAQLDELYHRQQGRCVFTGEQLTLPKSSGGVSRADYNISVDRKDSKKGYTIENVQLVTKAINMAKQALSDAEFVLLCKQVARHR